MRLGKLETWSYEKEKQKQKHFQKEYIDETTGDWKEGKKKLYLEERFWKWEKILKIREVHRDKCPWMSRDFGQTCL